MLAHFPSNTAKAKKKKNNEKQNLKSKSIPSWSLHSKFHLSV